MTLDVRQRALMRECGGEKTMNKSPALHAHTWGFDSSSLCLLTVWVVNNRHREQHSARSSAQTHQLTGSTNKDVSQTKGRANRLAC